MISAVVATVITLNIFRHDCTVFNSGWQYCHNFYLHCQYWLWLLLTLLISAVIIFSPWQHPSWLFPLCFRFFFCLMGTSAGPQKQAHGTIPSQDWQSLPCAGEEPDSNPGPKICRFVIFTHLGIFATIIGHLDNTSREHYSPWQYTGYCYL